MFIRAPHLALLGAAGLILSTSAAASQTPTTDSTISQVSPKASPAPRKEERYCETITMTGSRLAKKKFCGTRAEWADKKLQDRQVVDQFQTLQCVYSTNDSQGRPSC